MTFFGLHEAALIALIGAVALLFPRILPRISGLIGARQGAYREGARSPVEDAEHVYPVASPALQQPTWRRQMTTLARKVLETQ